MSSKPVSVNTKLPVAVWGEALSFLSLQEIVKGQTLSTCKAYHATREGLYTKILSKMRTMDCMDFFESFYNSSVRPIVPPHVDITNLEVLQGAVRATRVVLKHWHYRGRYEAGKSVDLIDHFVGTDKVAGYLATERAAQLTSLDLVEPTTPIALNTLQALVKRCPQLRELRLIGDEQMTYSCTLEENDGAVEELRGLKMLQSLSIQSIKLTDASLNTIVEMSSLTALDLSNCVEITRTGIAGLLRGLPHLQRLGIGRFIGSACPEDERWPSRAVALHGRNLTALSLAQSDDNCANIVNAVKGCPKLVHLDLTQASVTLYDKDKNLAAIQKANPKLKITGFEPKPEKKE